jgi:hypothetical protein
LQKRNFWWIDNLTPLNSMQCNKILSKNNIKNLCNFTIYCGIIVNITHQIVF